MRRRRLGKSDFEVPVVVLGAWAIGGWNWGGADDERSIDAIRAAAELGMDAVDTAPVYGFGHSERVVGEALRGTGGRVLVMTKCGLRWDVERERAALAFEARSGPDGRPLRIFYDSRPESVREECRRSLERLGVERIDLYQVHWPDPTTPVAETMGALVELVREGLVRAVGVSNYSPEEMDEARAALGDVPLASDQPRYSLVRREIEADVLPYARRSGIGLVVYSPLEQGLLTGRVTAERAFPPDDGRYARPTFRPENRSLVNAALRDVVAPVAERHGATLGQVAIAWVLAQEGVTAAIAGARSRAQVEENARAGELELAPEEVDAIGRAFASLELDLGPVPARS